MNRRIHAADAFGFTSGRRCVTMFLGYSTFSALIGAASGMRPVRRSKSLSIRKIAWFVSALSKKEQAMVRVQLRRVAAFLLLAFSGVLYAADVPALDTRVIVPTTPARLVRLTAHIRVTNSSSTDVSRFVFRVTAPPDLDSQRSVLVTSDLPPVVRKQHKNSANEYLEFQCAVPANQEVLKGVTFSVLLMPVDYSRVKSIEGRSDSKSDDLLRYLTPSRYIESDSAEVKDAAAFVFQRSRGEMSKARAAYEFPSKVLKFKLQKEPLGARQALERRTGDCTEFACLFVALCRTQSIPARKVGVFNLGDKSQLSVSQPNHDIAEVYLGSHGWIPVDPNLGRGRYDRPAGFGKLGNTAIVLNREGAWVWSTWLPPYGYDKSKPKPTVTYGIEWDAKVVKEGSARDLYRELVATKQSNE